MMHLVKNSLKSVSFFTIVFATISAPVHASQLLPPVVLDSIDAADGAVDEIDDSSDASTEIPVQTADSEDIIVRGERERKGEWKKVQTDNFSIYSKGGERELERVAANLERLHAVLDQMFERRVEAIGEPLPLNIVLTSGSSLIRSLQKETIPFHAGPFAPPFEGRAYYDPRSDGAVLAVSRRSLTFSLSDIRASVGARDDLSADGGGDFGGRDDLDFEGDGFVTNLGNSSVGYVSPRAIAGGGVRPDPRRRKSIRRDWETQVYDAYARHYFLTNLSSVYPGWYLDGIGAIFSQLDVRKSGDLEYGRQPPAMRNVLRAYGSTNTEAILSGEYLSDPEKAVWTPDHAWALTHYLLFGKPTDEHRAAFYRYMAAVAAGEPLDKAAQQLDGLEGLDATISAYPYGRTHYFWREVPASTNSDLHARRLTRGEGPLVEAHVAIGSRLNSSQPIKRRESFISEVRQHVRSARFIEESYAFLAEVECKAGKFEACRRTAEAMLSHSPGSARGLEWRARSMLGEALLLNGFPKAKAIRDARSAIIAANRADVDAPGPLQAYFNSFVDAGEAAPAFALVGMLRVIELAPAAPRPRLDIGQELIRQGLGEEARAVLLPLATGSYSSEITGAAKDILSQAQAQANR